MKTVEIDIEAAPVVTLEREGAWNVFRGAPVQEVETCFQAILHAPYPKDGVISLHGENTNLIYCHTQRYSVPSGSRLERERAKSTCRPHRRCDRDGNSGSPSTQV